MPRSRKGGAMKMNVENVTISVLVVILVVLVGYYVHLRMKKTENYDNGPKIVVILYHAEWCPHCKAMMPEWNKFKSAPASVVSEVVDHESENIPEEHKDRVEGFPTIVAEVNGEVKNYNGDRTADAINKWCKTLA